MVNYDSCNYLFLNGMTKGGAYNVCDSPALPPRGRSDRRRRGGGAARQRGQGAAGERGGRRGEAHHRRAQTRRDDLPPRQRRRLRHGRGRRRNRLPPPRHQQAPRGRGPRRHSNARVPGGSPRRHCQCQPGRSSHPHRRGRRWDEPPLGGRNGCGAQPRWLSSWHNDDYSRPVLQYPGPDEVHEVGRRRGRPNPLGCPKSSALSPRSVLPLPPGWTGAAFHPRGRFPQKRGLHRPGAGIFQGPH